MYCERCGKPNEDVASYCASCGAALRRLDSIEAPPAEKVCIRCAQTNPPEAQFCGRCGVALSAATPSPAKRRKISVSSVVSTVVATLFGMALLAGVAYALFFSPTETKPTVSEQQETTVTPRQNTAGLRRQAFDAYQAGRHPEAQRLFTQAILQDDANASAYNGRGLTHLALKEYPLAASDFTSAISRDPKFAAAYANRALAHRMTTDLNSAIADYTSAIELDPRNPARYLGRGYVYLLKKDYDAAIIDYDKAIELAPNAISYNNRAYAKISAGLLSEAISDATKAIQSNSSYSQAYDTRGHAYFVMGQYDLAVADVNKAIGLESKVPVYYRNRAMALAGTGDYAAAVADLEQCLNLRPDNELAAEAMQLLQRYRAKLPSNPVEE